MDRAVSDPQASQSVPESGGVVRTEGDAHDRMRDRRWRRPISWSGQAIIILVSIAYIVVEWRYNLRLMQIVADADLPRETMEQFSTTGRIVGAFGLAWGLLRPFVSAFRGTLVQVGLFCGIWLCMFFGLTAAFKIVIDHVEPERKRAAMAIFQMRGELLRGTDTDAGLPLPFHDPLRGPVMMADMAMLVHDPVIVKEAVAAMDHRAAMRAAELSDAAATKWIGYQRLHRAIDRLHRRQRNGADDVAAARDPVRAEEAYRARLGGMEPVRGLSRAEFIRTQLPLSTLREAGEILRALDEIVMTRPDGEVIRVRDVPHRMDRRTYDLWVEDQIEELTFLLAPCSQRINEHPHANAIVAAVYLPPVAMSLSLLAVFVNIAALAAQAMTSLTAIFSDRWWKPVALIAGSGLPVLVVVAAGAVAGGSAYTPYPRADAAREAMVEQLGIVGHFWSRAAAVQVVVNGHAERPGQIIDDAIAGLGRRLQSGSPPVQMADVDVYADP